MGMGIMPVSTHLLVVIEIRCTYMYILWLEVFLGIKTNVDF